MSTYYSINEQAARHAHMMNSMREYRPNQTTDEYRQMVDKAAAVAAEQISRKPDYEGEINDLLDRYARKLADWFNENSRVEAMCPSVLVSGGSNFPVAKKNRQNARRDAMRDKWTEIEKLVDRMRTIGTGGIKASDEKAIFKLQKKVDDLESRLELMKGINAYYRKHKTLDGCDLAKPETIESIKLSIEHSFYSHPKPFEDYELSLTRQEIRRLKTRIEELSAIKDAGTSEREIEGVDGLKVVENAEAMRIQLIFDGKPDADVRAVLKENGFRWAPSQNAWQRQLNGNGKAAASNVIQKLAAMQ